MREELSVQYHRGWDEILMTALYSVLHMFVDGVCAFAMFGTFLKQEQGYFYVLVYNFCAFALQMPFGAVLDLWYAKGRKQSSFAVACVGVVLTLVGAVTHPVILGIGNALFHIGGGVGIIHEDVKKGWRGRGLGVFVAPGALGLYLGMQLAQNGAEAQWLYGAGAFMAIACVGTACVLRRRGVSGKMAGYLEDGRGLTETTGVIPLAFCLFLAVVLRSYIGMAVTFSWKTTTFAAVLSTLAIVFGKTTGGFFMARFGAFKTAAICLPTAAVLYLFSGCMPAGAAALFLFNMTMPITLYLLICKLPQYPGFSFGLLTFGLFLGFLPEYYGLRALRGGVLGCAGSLVMLFILAAGVFLGNPDEAGTTVFSRWMRNRK